MCWKLPYTTRGFRKGRVRSQLVLEDGGSCRSCRRPTAGWFCRDVVTWSSRSTSSSITCSCVSNRPTTPTRRDLHRPTLTKIRSVQASGIRVLDEPLQPISIRTAFELAQSSKNSRFDWSAEHTIRYRHQGGRRGTTRPKRLN